MVLCEAFSQTDCTFKDLKLCYTNFRNNPKKFLILSPKSNHGLDLNKSKSCFNRITTSRLVHMNGQTLVFQESKDLTIVQSEEM